jgi:hypothetical protein
MGILLNQLQSAQIVYRLASKAVSMVGLTVGSTVGHTVNSTWLCWAINLSEAFNSSDERLNKLGLLQTCFTGLSLNKLVILRAL